jgi:uncharacterized protein YigE (DUF2233 family)
MRFHLLPAAALAIASCAPAKPLRKAPPVAAAQAVTIPQPAAPASPVSHPTPADAPRATSQNIAGIMFEGVAFDSRNYRLSVSDQPGGPGSRFADSSSAAKASGGIAAVNAGFFTPEGAPLGLVVASGKTSGSWNTASSLGSGAWFENTSGETGIARREKLGRSGASAMRELIQAGPLLVENGSPVSGLDATKPSIRIMILWDGGTRWWIGRATTTTLAELGNVLSTSRPAGWPVKQALNLDGGRSSDLWISEAVSGGPALRRPPWNRPVRNFLVLLRK